MQLPGVGGVDDPQHGLGLRQVDPSGQEGAEGEFAGLRRPGAGRADASAAGPPASGGEPSVWISATGWPV